MVLIKSQNNEIIGIDDIMMGKINKMGQPSHADLDELLIKIPNY